VNGALVAAILALGLGVIVVRRRSVALALVAAQSLALGIGALDLAFDRSDDFLVASLVLLTKAAVLPVLLLIVMRRTREPRLVAPAASALVRLAGAGALALAAAALVPPLGLGDPQIEHSAAALVLVGIAIAFARRPAFMQLLGLIVTENGVSLLAVSVPGGLSYVIELGALFDLALVVCVAAAFTQRIHLELGTGDTELLRGLRD
jgi:hydrogenase-4 membrane subunit HyfE